jgi:hypothetical protein
MYLKEEIQAEAATQNLGGLARFLPIAGLFHGQTLNVSAKTRCPRFAWPAFETRLRVRERRHRSSTEGSSEPSNGSPSR